MAKIHPLGLAFLAAKREAEIIDAGYSLAIVRQFGKGKTRWDVAHARPNSQTDAAYRAKRDADRKMRAALEAMRAAGATVHPMEEGE